MHYYYGNIIDNVIRSKFAIFFVKLAKKVCFHRHTYWYRGGCLQNFLPLGAHVQYWTERIAHSIEPLTILHKKILLMFDTSPVVSIWLEMSINWHTNSQGAKKKCAYFSRGRINSYPAGTARNQGSFTSMGLWSVQSFLSSTVCL